MHTAPIMGFNQQWWENNGNIKAIHIMGYMIYLYITTYYYIYMLYGHPSHNKNP